MMTWGIANMVAPPRCTNAMGLLADMTYFFGREEFHATAKGFRAVVPFEGQLYEVICNPLYKQAEKNHENL